MKNNIKGLLKAAKNKQNAAIERTENAIDELLSNNKTINFKSVSSKAKVSTSWLYRNKDLRSKIENYRKEQLQMEEPEKNSIIKNKVISILKNKVKTLKEENSRLKAQIEVIYGQLHKKKS